MIRFISDLHLSEREPRITERFLQFMREKKLSTSALYILGDFFETWIGDDNRSALIHTIQDALKSYRDNGIKIYFMPGNRDFLLGEIFCDSAGMKLLSDPYLIHLNGTPTLLMHGDLLCTEDKRYQWFRKVIRLPVLHHIFLKMPLEWRQHIAQKLRNMSKKAHNPANPPDPFNARKWDAVESGIIDALTTWQAKQLIHGHTHKLAIHDHTITLNETVKRYVLGDWRPNQGNALCFDGQKFFFEYF